MEQLLSFLADDGNPERFMEAFGIERYKPFPDEHLSAGLYYTILRTAEGLMLVTFDEETVFTPQRITFSDSAVEARIEQLAPGASLEDVIAADPDGQFVSLYASWSEVPAFSYHFFENGTAFFLWYEDDIVVDMARFTL